MPVRPVMSKRRHSSQAELAAWAMVFVSGVDHLGDLAEFGGEWGASYDADPLHSMAADAWSRLGRDFIRTDYYAESANKPIWAEREFGPCQ